MNLYHVCRLPRLSLAVTVLVAALGTAHLPIIALAQRGPSPIAVSPVVIEQVPLSQAFVGTMQPIRRSVVGSAVAGRVVEFPLKPGDRVESGGALAQILTGTLEIELAEAEATMRLREQELAELENGTRPEDIAVAKAAMAGAEALATFSKARYERVEKVFKQGRVATADEFEEALSNHLQAEQKYIATKAAYDLAVAGPRTERIEQAKAALAAQQEQVHHIRDRLKKHTIISRFDGYVVAEHTEVGAWVNQGDLVAEVVDLSKVDLEVFVPQRYIDQVHVGMTSTVVVEGLVEPIDGVVKYIIPQADVKARTFPVKVRLPNPLQEDGTRRLKAGMLAHASLPVGRQEQSTLVPKDALVLSTSGTPMVYVTVKQGEGMTVRPISVSLGVASGTLIEARGQLSPEDLVVVRGNERIFPGMPVQITQRLEPRYAPERTSRPSD